MSTATLSPSAVTQIVLWGALLIGLLMGAVAQATRFCIMGALADWFAYRGSARLAMWVLAVAVAATGGMALTGLQWLDAARTVALSERFLWASYALGGAVFGYGMVLAGGCPQRNLVRAGAGNLKAWVTLVIAALAAQMTLRGVLAVPRVSLLDAAALQLPHPQDLGSFVGAALGAAPAQARWVVFALALAAAGVVLWRSRRAMLAEHWMGGLLVGALVTAGWALTGHVGFLEEHPETLEAAWLGTYSHRPESLTFAAPLAHGLDLLTLWSDKNNTATFGVMVALGVLLGSTVSAWRRKEFHVEAFRSPRDLADHLIGGLLMGFGGVTAMGCSIGQGVSGLGLLSAGACVAVAGMVAGAWLALRRQAARIEREPT